MKYVIANWKMYLGVRESSALARGVLRTLRGMEHAPQVILAPTYPALLHVGKAIARSKVRLAAQDIAAAESGAFTGQVSARVAREVGAHWTLVGHSERRALGDTDVIVRKKLERALEEGLNVIVCVGEELAAREADQAVNVVKAQVDALLRGVHVPPKREVLVAYEPRWAIGTGRTPALHEVVELHEGIRETIEELGLHVSGVLYGGSVDPENVYQFVQHEKIDGVLIGGASKTLRSLSDMIELTSEAIAAKA